MSTVRSGLSRIALAAWCGVDPDKLPAEKMWVEHPNNASREAWERVVAAILEQAAKVCEANEAGFLSPEYATDQPGSSFSERFACRECARDIRALQNAHKPEVAAKPSPQSPPGRPTP